MAIDCIYRKTLLVVDDHEVVADGIASALGDAYIVLKAVDMVQALEVDAIHPEIGGYVVDLSIGAPTDGLALIGELRERGRRKPVTVFTMHAEPWNVALLRKTDVEGIVLKGDGVAEFREAVDTVMGGGRYRSPEFDACCRELDRADDVLTPVDVEVLRLISEGLTSREIASRVCLSEKGVEYHRGNVVRKLSAATMGEAVSRAVRLGII